MCGIVGLFGRLGYGDTAIVKNMADSIRHRGPDDEGVDVVEEGHVILGHRRLSILDLSPSGHQPMASDSRRSWIVFNGEIYNFRELKVELKAMGVRFRSDSDTEMILAAYECWGLEAVKRFHGMFAFALWDGQTRKLHLCRDRFGVKPLYYSQVGSRFAFSSELRALNGSGLSRQAIDPVAALEFVQYGYFSSTASIFSDVRAVAPGTILTINQNLDRDVYEFWSARQLFQSDATQQLRSELEALPEEALLDRVEQALERAFQYRMIADVPVGLFLSGGIDSSTVAAILSRRSGVKLRTFTIGYENSEFDEAPIAREVARLLGAHHTEQVVSEAAALGVAQRLAEIADEPIGDSSLIPTFLVSQMARQHVTVALSADGADELFGGYPRYSICAQFLRRRPGPYRAMYRLSANMIERLPAALVARTYAAVRVRGGAYAGINDKIRKFVRMSRGRNRFEAYDASVSEWSAPDAARLLAIKNLAPSLPQSCFETFHGAEMEEEFMHFDTVRYLPGDLLTKVDRASMAVSLEVREPFLDHELAQIALALPMRWKIRDGQSKYVLRRILARYLPVGFFDRPKKGFSAPVGAWLRGPLREMLRYELSPARIDAIGLLDAEAVQLVLKDFLSEGRRASPAGMWFLLQLQQWAGRWLKSNSVSSGTM